jgi:hypothetical protein
MFTGGQIRAAGALIRWCIWKPSGRVSQVESTGTVESLFGAASEHAIRHEGVLIVIVAGPVEGEAPGVGRSAIAQAAQLEDGAAGITSIDVGEVGPEADLNAGEISPRARARALRRWVRLDLVDLGGAFTGLSWRVQLLRRQAGPRLVSTRLWAGGCRGVRASAARSLGVKRQTNGHPVTLWRSSKRASRSWRAAWSAKSADLITLRWMTERTIWT